MSKRTAQADKAIRLAWTRERDLVQEGKGTRDWTKEQQKDILDPEKGRAYDDNGRAFEGQHMKSVEQYPDYQGNPDNIQFLTREEHLEAHQGNWQNPTNGFFDPDTKNLTPFDEDELVPCEVIELSDPIIVPDIGTEELSKNKVEPDINEDKEAEKQRIREEISEMKRNVEEMMSKNSPKKKPANIWKTLRDGVSNLGNRLKEEAKDFGPYALKHPDEVADAMMNIGRGFLAIKGIKGSTGGRRKSDSGSASSSMTIFDDIVADTKFDNIIPDTKPSPKQKRSSPMEHTVGKPGDGQHYWKNGERVWMPKKPYKRGGKKKK